MSLKGILQQLSVLRLRFQIYQSPNVDWARPFDTNTDYLWRIQWLRPDIFATNLTMEDYILLRQLNISVLTGTTSPVRNRINQRWNDLSRSVEECFAADLAVGLEIEKLAVVC